MPALGHDGLQVLSSCDYPADSNKMVFCRYIVLPMEAVIWSTHFPRTG